MKMNNNRIKTRTIHIFTSLTIIFLIIAIFYTRFYVSPANYDRLTRNFQSTLIEKENHLDNIIIDINSGIINHSDDSLFLSETYKTNDTVCADACDIMQVKRYT